MKKERFCIATRPCGWKTDIKRFATTATGQFREVRRDACWERCVLHVRSKTSFVVRSISESCALLPQVGMERMTSKKQTMKRQSELVPAIAINLWRNPGSNRDPIRTTPITGKQPLYQLSQIPIFKRTTDRSIGNRRTSNCVTRD